jgi:hypothetical protein
MGSLYEKTVGILVSAYARRRNPKRTLEPNHSSKSYIRNIIETFDRINIKLQNLNQNATKSSERLKKLNSIVEREIEELRLRRIIREELSGLGGQI